MEQAEKYSSTNLKKWRAITSEEGFKTRPAKLESESLSNEVPFKRSSKENFIR